VSFAGDNTSVAARRWGDELYQALVDCVPIAPVTDGETALTIRDAYRIQLEMIGRRTAAEQSRIIGRKIGVTSKAVQDMLNVHEPDFGHLLSTMLCADGASLSMETLIAPRAEGELAFLLNRDLAGPGITSADVLRATDYVMPCFEIVDSRIRDWKIRIQDTVADNASAGMFVLGDSIVDPRQIDLSLVGMTIEKNGEVVGTGAGAAALGHPLNAVAWLANTLGEFDITLRAGEIILSGALSALVPVFAGDCLRASFGGVGNVSVRFSAAGADGA
jgi:2-oxopent-4-enoate/cis-2-oxohex-4-enoate hydratase